MKKLSVNFKDLALILLFGIVAYLWFFRDNEPYQIPEYIKREYKASKKREKLIYETLIKRQKTWEGIDTLPDSTIDSLHNDFLKRAGYYKD